MSILQHRGVQAGCKRLQALQHRIATKVERFERPLVTVEGLLAQQMSKQFQQLGQVGSGQVSEAGRVLMWLELTRKLVGSIQRGCAQGDTAATELGRALREGFQTISLKNSL